MEVLDEDEDANLLSCFREHEWGDMCTHMSPSLSPNQIWHQENPSLKTLNSRKRLQMMLLRVGYQRKRAGYRNDCVQSESESESESLPLERVLLDAEGGGDCA